MFSNRAHTPYRLNSQFLQKFFLWNVVSSFLFVWLFFDEHAPVSLIGRLLNVAPRCELLNSKYGLRVQYKIELPVSPFILSSVQGNNSLLTTNCSLESDLYQACCPAFHFSLVFLLSSSRANITEDLHVCSTHQTLWRTRLAADLQGVHSLIDEICFAPK